MILELLRLALVLALLVVLPGVVLVNALFPAPRSSLTRLERAYLAVSGGILLLMLVGIVLGFLPHGERGWFQTIATGFPHLELAVLGVTGLLFWVGLTRGAYPRLSARFSPSSPGAPPPRRGWRRA